MAFLVGRCLLQQRLNEFGITQQQLADRLHMPISQISDYVNNRKKMSLRNAKSIAAEINCYIDDLYEWVPVHSAQRKRSRHKE